MQNKKIIQYVGAFVLEVLLFLSFALFFPFKEIFRKIFTIPQISVVGAGIYLLLFLGYLIGIFLCFKSLINVISKKKFLKVIFYLLLIAAILILGTFALLLIALKIPGYPQFILLYD